MDTGFRDKLDNNRITTTPNETCMNTSSERHAYCLNDRVRSWYLVLVVYTSHHEDGETKNCQYIRKMMMLRGSIDKDAF